MLTHKHRILPGHMGGTYTSDNVEVLTVTEHAEAHRLLWENFGCEEDRIAWQGLSGQIDQSEIIQYSLSAAGKKGGATRKGSKHTLETRVLIGAAQLGRKATLKARENMRAAQEGHPVAPQTGAKISAANTGKIASLETREKMKKAHLGLRHTLEALVNMRVSQTGHPVSAQTAANISLALKGRKPSREHKVKQWLGHLRNTLTREILRAWECTV